MENIAKQAYTAYFTAMQGSDDFGRALPIWEQLSEYEQAAWISVAQNLEAYFNAHKPS